MAGGDVGALDGKGALVTGGSRGIGRAIVKRLAADGAAVVFSYRQNEAAAADVVREVAADGGRIIAISTLNTRLRPPGGALYTGAKGALENFTTVAALEFGRRGITANVVSPGTTDTELLREANPGVTFEDEVAQDRAPAARPAGGHRGGGGLPGRSRLRLDQRPEPGRRRRPAALTP